MMIVVIIIIILFFVSSKYISHRAEQKMLSFILSSVLFLFVLL